MYSHTHTMLFSLLTGIGWHKTFTLYRGREVTRLRRLPDCEKLFYSR